MTNKTIGYIELEWTCPNCNNKNPGMKKFCGTCGAPQPANVAFEMGQNSALINDAEKQTLASKGADIYCPFCNTRNTANAEICSQCGGDLQEGIRRESGRVISGPAATTGKPIKCTACGTENPAGSATCSACGTSLAKNLATNQPQATSSQKTPSRFRPWMMLPIAGVVMLLCVIIGFLFFKTTDKKGIVNNTQWERSIAIEEQREVVREAWRDQLPAGAQPLSCQQEYRSRQDSPAAGAREVCSTKLVDQGNGSAKVEETCYYEIYDDYCKYNSLEWQTVNNIQASGTDQQPQWPNSILSSGQREGNRSETYTVYFNTSDGIKEYSTSDAALFAQFEPGTEWTLSINTLGTIIEVNR